MGYKSLAQTPARRNRPVSLYVRPRRTLRRAPLQGASPFANRKKSNTAAQFIGTLATRFTQGEIMQRKRAFTQLCGLSAVLAALACHSSFAAQTVAPGTNATTEGSSSDGGTFGEGGGGDFRMQSIYSSSEFTGYASPFLITGIAFRPDASSLGGGDSSGWSTSPISLSSAWPNSKKCYTNQWVKDKIWGRRIVTQ